MIIHALLALAMLPSVPAPVTGGPAQQRVMLAWLPGEVRCGGAVVAAQPMRRPWTALLWQADPNLAPMTYGFDIDGDGRATSIHRLVGGAPYVPFADDIAPALAATRFAAGAARTGCTVAFLPRQTAMADTPVADLISYSVTPSGEALPAEGWARIKGAGDCDAAPRPEPLVQAFPDFRGLPATPGVKDWSMVGYDLDAKGRPGAVHLVAGTGNAALGAAAVKAMAASRFTGGVHHGCLYPYWRAPATLVAPAESGARPHPAGATCPEQRNWVTPPRLTYPEGWRRRAIEGWAVVTYDVAPWGEVGNIHVADAQPSDEFGVAATEVIRNARVATTQGLVGCVDRVAFKMPAGESPVRAGG